MNKCTFLVASLALLLVSAIGLGQDESAPRPNIVVILVDDMGYSDIGCYGGEVETPRLDALAEDGLRFTQFYNSGRCCPTRASLMTGLHPHQVGIGHMTESPTKPSTKVDDPYQGYLNRDCVTIAEVLKSNGYATMMAGKWHLSYSHEDAWPRQRGFDRFFGFIPGAGHYFVPCDERALTLDNEPFALPEEAVANHEFYVTDAFTDYAMEFIDDADQADPDQPFFLYLAFNAPHWPLEAKPEILDKYVGRYMGGWDQLMEDRHARMVEMGLIDPRLTPAPHEGPRWDTLSEQQHRELDLRMAAYAACIDSIDENVGRLVDHLDEINRRDDTLIFFLSDNGSCQEGGNFGSGDEHVIRNPWEGSGTVGGARLGKAWAIASNSPLRKYKHFVHEGGMNTPLVVNWPSGLNEETNGEFVRQYAYLPDIMSTCVELSGAEYPTEYGGHTIPPMEGRSLVPLLEGDVDPIHTTPICWEHEKNRAIRIGDWKLVWAGKGPWELYDMTYDRGELNDLSDEMPQRVAELSAIWREWADRNGVQYGN